MAQYIATLSRVNTLNNMHQELSPIYLTGNT